MTNRLGQAIHHHHYVAIQTSVYGNRVGPDGQRKEAVHHASRRKIVYYFAEYQPLFEHYEDRIEFRHRMPKADAIDRLTDTLVVYDDLMDEADERLTRIFTTDTSRLYSWCRTFAKKTDTCERSL